MTSVYGAVSCKAEVEGVPDIALSFSSVAALDGLMTHPCVALADTGVALAKRKIKFTPPLETFELCQYRVAAGEEMNIPIRAFYQMKEMSSSCVKLLVQLKLHATFPNQFEYCSVTLPFFNRGHIANHEGTPTSGSISGKYLNAYSLVG